MKGPNKLLPLIQSFSQLIQTVLNDVQLYSKTRYLDLAVVLAAVPENQQG